tara:strand:- start:701 stop:1027 length:327 start_codon:yes stop_codon:yes gene_type:complete
LNKIHISTILINMVKKNKILSDLSKFAVDAMSAFSGLREEIETIVSLRVDKVINKMNLVKKDEFDVLKKMVQNLVIDKEKLKKSSKKSTISKKKTLKKASSRRKSRKK